MALSYQQGRGYWDFGGLSAQRGRTRPKTAKNKNKKTLDESRGRFWQIFAGKLLGQKRVLGWPGPFSDTKPPDSSDIIIKPYSFPTFTWFYLIQVLRDKPAFSRF